MRRITMGRKTYYRIINERWSYGTIATYVVVYKYRRDPIRRPLHLFIQDVHHRGF